MLIGYNNDVEYRGKEFHIQTEDHGKSTAKIESQIFHQGQILDTEIVSYDSVLDEDAAEEKIEEKLQSLLEATHKGLYKRLVSGEYDEMVGLDPIEDEAPEADPEEFEPSQDRVPTAAKQIEEEGEEAFNQFHENQAQKHVNLDDLKSHLADQDSDAGDEDGEAADEEPVETAESIEPTIEKRSPETIESQSPFDGGEESDVGLDTGESDADGAAVIESRPTPPPESSKANLSESSSEAIETAPSQSSGGGAASGDKGAVSGTSRTGGKSTSASGSSRGKSSSSSMAAPSSRAGPVDGLPQTGAEAWNGCEEPDESFSIVELVESFLAE